MKKTFSITLVALILCVCMIVSISSCNSSQDNTDDHADEQITAINDTIEKMLDTDKTINKDIDDLKKEIDTLKTTLKSLDTELDELSATTQDTSAYLNTFKQSIELQLSDIEADIDALKTNNTETNASIDAIDESVNAIKDRLGAVESDITLLKSTVDTIKSRVEQNEKDISELKENVSGLENKISGLENKISNFENRINCLEGNHVLNTTYDEYNHTTACQFCSHSIVEAHLPVNGVCSCGMEYAAKVGNILYNTFSEALAAWTNGTTLTLYKDITDINGSLELSGQKNITLDLNGYTLDNSNNGYSVIKISNGCTLTVKDSSENSTGIVNGDIYVMYMNDTVGTLYFESGTIDSVFNNSIFTMTGGCIAGIHENYGIYTNSPNSTTVISGGEINSGSSSAITCFYGILTIKDDANVNGIIKKSVGTIRVEGGTFSTDPSEFVDTTKYSVANENGIWTVTEK